MSTLLRSLSILTLAASAAALGACATAQPATAGNWNFPNQAAAEPKPLMRLATLPMNPAPAAPYEDYTDEPTRFLFHPRIVVIDDQTGAAEDTGGGDVGDMVGAEE